MQAGVDLQVSCSPCVGMRENRERREAPSCLVAFVLLACELPLTEPPPEASSSVAREYLLPEAGEALTVFPLSALLRV